jgi:hypothetical protein
MDRRVDHRFRSSLEGPTRHVRQTRAIVPPRNFERQSPFLMLSEDWFDAGGGFPPEPRRGFQTVTLVLEGGLEFEDHTGARALLGPGDAHWFVAGRGALRSERAHGRGVTRTLHLWLNLPARDKLAPPSQVVQRRAQVPVHTFEGGEARVYAGTSGSLMNAPASLWPLTLLDVTVRSGQEYCAVLPADWRAFLYMMQGAGFAGSGRAEVSAGDVAWFEPGNSGQQADSLGIAAATDLRALLYAAPPIAEAVAVYGSFVMNTMAEIEQALMDYQAGRFTTPAQAAPR